MSVRLIKDKNSFTCSIKLMAGSVNQNMDYIANYYQLVYIWLPLIGMHE